jgi:L-lactate dehydrogenase
MKTELLATEPSEWVKFANAVLFAAGLTSEMAGAVAEGLVKGELYGHTTHGLALLEPYLTEIAAGRMTTSGIPEVMAETDAVALWDARRLPGIWTTTLAVDTALSKASSQGVGVVAIRNNHHIGCLAIYLEAAARAGKIVIVHSSDPAVAHVAPFGGSSPVLTPNPIAAGIPTVEEPILIDVSTSITTAGNCARARALGQRIQGQWLIGPDGNATDDPAVLGNGGAIMPIGGLDHGHKGFGLSLLVEALTQGLSGFGRADQPSGWGASVLVTAFDPDRFAGTEPLTRQTTWLADACRTATPAKAGQPVRLPGQMALARQAESRRQGLNIAGPVADSLKRAAAQWSIDLPPNTKIGLA